jgi:stress response protein SCP2
VTDIGRGQRLRIDQFTPTTTLDVGIDVASEHNLSFDISCFGLGADGRLVADEWLVFFNNTRSPGESVSALGPHGGDEQVFRIELELLPVEVHRLVFTVNLDGDGAMSQIAKGHIRVLDGAAPLIRYPYYGADFTVEQSVVVAELYRKDGWRFAAVGQGFAGGLDALVAEFGGEVDDSPGAEATAAPAPVPVPVVAPVPAPEPVAPAATPSAAPVRTHVFGLGPDLSGPPVSYKVLSQADKRFSGRFDPETVQNAVGSYASMGWTVVGTAVDRIGRKRDSLLVLLAREH